MERNLKRLNTRAKRLARAAEKANPNQLRKMQRQLKAERRDVERGEA